MLDRHLIRCFRSLKVLHTLGNPPNVHPDSDVRVCKLLHHVGGGIARGACLRGSVRRRWPGRGNGRHLVAVGTLLGGRKTAVALGWRSAHALVAIGPGADRRHGPSEGLVKACKQWRYSTPNEDLFNDSKEGVSPPTMPLLRSPLVTERPILGG
jgi:hypothetical protein